MKSRRHRGVGTEGVSGTDQVLVLDKYATSNDGDTDGSHCDESEMVNMAEMSEMA